MAQQHTPVWRGTGNGFVRDENNQAVCSLYGENGNPELDDETLRRERLVVAAPDILAALKEALDIGGDIHGWADRARSAISKAEPAQ